MRVWVDVAEKEFQILRVANLEAQAQPVSVRRHRGEVSVERPTLNRLLALERTHLALQLLLLAAHLLAQRLQLLRQALAELLGLRGFLAQRLELAPLVLLAPLRLLARGGEVLLLLHQPHVLLLGLHHVGLVRGDRLLHGELALRAPHLHLPARGIQLALEQVEVHDAGDIGRAVRHRGGHDARA